MVRNDPDLDRDAPWKSVMPYPANMSEAWTRVRFDWWLLEFWQSDAKKRVDIGLLLLMMAATAATGALALRRPRRLDGLGDDQERQRLAAA
jgi:hypothetical protein